MGHVWVALNMTPIEPELQADGSIDVYAREGAVEAAEEDTQHGCAICHTPLNKDTIHEDCEGQP